MVKEHLALIQCQGDPEINEETVIHPDVYRQLAKQYVEWGGNSTKVFAWYDHENNIIKEGINFRATDETD